MSKEKKPILNLQKGCPFCGGTDLCYGYDPVLSRIDIVCKACNFTFSYKMKNLQTHFCLLKVYGTQESMRKSRQ